MRVSTTSFLMQELLISATNSLVDVLQKFSHADIEKPVSILQAACKRGKWSSISTVEWVVKNFGKDVWNRDAWDVLKNFHQPVISEIVGYLA